MRNLHVLIFLFLTAVFVPGARAQYDPAKVCRLDDGKMVFTIDRRWNAAQIKEVSTIFDLDSALIAGAFSGKTSLVIKGSAWTIRKVDATRFDLEKSTGATDQRYNRNEIILVDDKELRIAASALRESEPYGVNRLTFNTVIQAGNNRIRFFLPGRQNARTIYLSGSFNNWSTMQTPMLKTDSGWTVTLRLAPGKYTYKFIVDGKWSSDPYNKLRENDTHGGFNSVFFCYNYRFILKGYQSAKSVVVAGSFNNWRTNELKMIPYRGSWVLSAYIREGTHAYKFIVDGNWINDPACKVNRPDGMGNMNSFFSIGDTMIFRLNGYQDAQNIVLAGNFNGWNQGELFMTRIRNGWELPYVLGPGNYEYKYIVDGKWMIDPSNPNTTGAGEFTNSFLAVKPNYTFTLKGFSGAREICLSGNFNGWSQTGYRMNHKNGIWDFSIYLQPGKYSYKFVVDGKWIMDPANELWEDNEYGTGNSVIWIEP